MGGEFRVTQKLNVLENIWYVGALSEELVDKPLARTICGFPMVIYRGESGQTVALEDRCPHRQAPLSMGNVLGDDIQCNYHGFMFDGSGGCTHIPRQERVPSTIDIRAFKAVERWGFVWIWWGDQSLADESMIPNLPWTVEPHRRVKYFYWHVKANFQLMADNLLDVSHVDFLHKDSIASKIDDTAKGAVAPKVSFKTVVEGNVVTTIRRVHDTLLAGVAAKWHGSEGPVTRVSTGRWEPPNCCIMQLQFQDPDGVINRTINMEHIMTPETDTTCHYFMDWTWDFGDPDGYPTHHDVDREQRGLIEIEDIPMVEAQQRNIITFGSDARDIPVKQDKHVNEVHRVLRRMYEEQGVIGRNEVSRQVAE